jgi:adenosylcobinamide-phosphate synthase
MVNSQLVVYSLLIGFLLDLLLGDPRWLPHPVRFFGNSITFFTEKLNHGNKRGWKGAMMALLLITVTYGLFEVVFWLVGNKELIYLTLGSAGVFYGLANRALIEESYRVMRALEKKGLEEGRKRLSYIVGRETKNLDEQQVRTAVLETLAENLSDGVIAPLFYYALGGVPAMMAYKMANTLDSMIGYKDDQYREFGQFAARFDDVVNFIPARITAFLMVLLSLSPRGLIYIFRFGHRHHSPNAGYPEAALAGILNGRFGGPNVYHGLLIEKPYIGETPRLFTNNDFYKACILNFCTSVVFVGMICAMWLFF